jgi:antitoxin ChpS
MHKTNLRKGGGSVMLAVPPAVLDILHLRPGAQVGVTIENGRIVVEPRMRPGYTLNELLAQSNHKTARSNEDREWVADQPVGAEIL